ncbi:hypothetical protein niasHT_027066 [Heterodera trifolii]
MLEKLRPPKAAPQQQPSPFNALRVLSPEAGTGTAGHLHLLIPRRGPALASHLHLLSPEAGTGTAGHLHLLRPEAGTGSEAASPIATQQPTIWLSLVQHRAVYQLRVSERPIHCSHQVLRYAQFIGSSDNDKQVSLTNPYKGIWTKPTALDTPTHRPPRTGLTVCKRQTGHLVVPR